MVKLQSIDYGNVRKLVNSTALPSISLSQYNNGLQGYNGLGDFSTINQDLMDFAPSNSSINDMVQYGLLRRGWDPYQAKLQASQATAPSNLTKGQKQVQTLKERLAGSGVQAQKPEDAGKRGWVGDLLNALGAPGGAVTTTVNDILNGGNTNLVQDIKKGVTGKGRKTGSDILNTLGVKNKIAKGAGGFALDVLLDPTSYLGVGLAEHAGTAAAKDLAKKALQDAGHKVPKEADLTKLIDKAVGPKSYKKPFTTDQRVADIAQAFGRPVEKTTQDGGKVQFTLSSAKPNMPKQNNLQIGLPFTNKQADILNIQPALSKAGSVTKSIFDKLPNAENKAISGLGHLGKATAKELNKTFNAYPIHGNIANLFKQRNYAVNESHRGVVQLAEHVDKLLGGGYKKNPELHNALAMSLDSGDTAKLDSILKNMSPEKRDKVLAARQMAKDTFQQIKQNEIKHGIMKPENVRDFYFAHLVDGPSEAKQAFKDQFGVDLNPDNTNGLPTSTRFNQERTAPELKDLQAAVHAFNRTYDGPGKLSVNTDIGEVLATRKLASEVAIQNKKLFTRIKGLGPQFTRPAQDAVGDPNFVPLKNPPDELKGVAVRQDVAKFLQDWKKVSQPGEDLNSFTQTLSTIPKVWKGAVTFSGSHIMNNIIGSMWNNWMMGVKNPEFYKKAAKLIGPGKGRKFEQNPEKLKSVDITLPDGSKLDGQQLMDLMKQMHVIHAGSEADIMHRGIKGAGNKSPIRKALGSVQHVSEATDDWARAAGFMSELHRTGDPWTAAQNVKKYLFDYAELSPREKKSFGKLVPFYAWTRKNIPLQIMGLIRKPGMFTGATHAMQEASKAVGVNMDQAPGYVANAMNIPLWKDSNGNVTYLSPYALPMNDLFNLIGSTNGGAGGVAQYLTSQTAPWLQFPYALATNKNLFNGAPIDKQAEQTGGHPSLGAIAKYSLGQTGVFNAIAKAMGINDKANPDNFVTRKAPGLEGQAGLRQYNPNYYHSNVLPYQYANQLRRQIQDTTNQGQTVYTKTELNQANETGLSPDKVRLIRSILHQHGQSATKSNIENLANQMQ